MQIPERPFDGDPPGDGVPSYEWLDEWLCEYVDGTMDPSLEAVFEQYVEANPELKAHVRRLRQTRELLCGCDVPEEALAEPTAEGGGEEDEEMPRPSPAPALSDAMHDRPAAALGLVSSIAVALVVGFLAGSMLVDPATFSPRPTVSAVDRQVPTPQTVRTEAPARPGRVAATPPSPVSAFSVDESFVPRAASSPLAGPDTLRTPAPFGAGGER